MKNDKNFVLLQLILDKIKEGETPTMIAKKSNIPKTTLSYHVDKLKKLGCIEKIGYGVWEYKKELPKPQKKYENWLIDSMDSQNSYFSKKPKKEIRGHAFIWKIRFYDPIDWDKVKFGTLHYQKLHKGKTYRILFKNRKIWLTQQGLIIYEPLDFMGRSSFSVKGNAIFEMDRLIKGLLKRLKVKFRSYYFTTSREHYAQIKNALARQYNDKKEKLYIKNKEGTTWLWIDHSLGEDELETNEVITSRKVQEWFNDHKQHHFSVNSSFILNGLDQTNQAVNKLANKGIFYGEKIDEHVYAIKRLAELMESNFELLKKYGELIDKKLK